MRNEIDFNENWTFEGKPVSLPHTWNAEDGQDGGNDYQRGTFVYEKEFDRPEGEHVFLEVGAAAMTADVTLNGHVIAHHEGGFSAFWAEMTPFLKERNHLSIAVDNGVNDHVYPQKADFTFYGGLYRGVKMLTFDGAHFGVSSGFFAGAEVQKDGSARIHFMAKTAGDVSGVRVRIEGDGIQGSWNSLEPEPASVNAGSHGGVSSDGKQERHNDDVDGTTGQRETGWTGEIQIREPHLWNGLPDPYLYTVTAQVLEQKEAASEARVTDEVQQMIGIRSFKVDPERGFFLNGRSYPLIGVARHQDRREYGNALSHAQMEEDMELICGMGANMIRLAHYQHDPHFYDLCDRYGMIVWAEIPYITEHKNNPAACRNTMDQMTELILQNRQHPSIICWALSNEITVTGGPTPAIYENHRKLNDLCHRLDPTRLTAMAHAFMLDPDDPLVSLPDVSSYNLYYGWYLGNLEDNDKFFDDYHAAHPDRAIGLSEYGADALIQYQTSNPKRGDNTEQYQCLYHEHMLNMWSERPYIWMMSVWNMFDFGADGRSDAGEPGVNHKGLVTFDRKICKDAYYLYKAWLSKEPFVHICGRRYANRAEEVTKVKVYSNQPEVTLLFDGKAVGTQKGSRVFEFEVPLSFDGFSIDKKIDGKSDAKQEDASDENLNEKSDEKSRKNHGERSDAKFMQQDTPHRIEAFAGDCRDVIEIRRVKEPDPSYQAPQSQIVNWFDADEEIEREGYYSIHDSVASVKESDEASRIYQELTAPLQEKVAAAYGDVAKNVKISTELQHRMDQMSVEETLRQMGSLVTSEFIHRLNHALNQVSRENA